MQSGVTLLYGFCSGMKLKASQVTSGMVKSKRASHPSHLAVSGQQKPFRHLLGLAYSDPSAASSGEEVD